MNRVTEKSRERKKYAPLLWASIWVVELTVTLQMGQCRCCLAFLGSFSAGVSPVGLSCWAAVSLVREAPVGSSRPSGFWKWGEETDRSADETSDIGVRTTELEWASSTLSTGSESQTAAKERENQLYKTTCFWIFEFKCLSFYSKDSYSHSCHFKPLLIQ